MSSDLDVRAWLEQQGGQRARRRVRLVMLLDAADYAVIAPIPKAQLHALAFLADVLSPIYDLEPLAVRILKRREAPYFPELQWEIDRLVGMGICEVSSLTPLVEGSKASISASYALERAVASGLLAVCYEDSALLKLRDHFRALASALGEIDEKDLDAATQADATWHNGHGGAVIDYAEWYPRNLSSRSADRIEKVASETWGGSLAPAAKLSLYVRYMRRAANE